MSRKIYKNYDVNVEDRFKIIQNDFIPVYYDEVSFAEHRDENGIHHGDEKVVDDICEELDSIEEENPIEEEISIEKANGQAEEIIRKANIEAEEIIRKAMQEANTIKCEVEEDARTTGYKEGLELGKNEADTIIVEAKQIRAEAKKTYKETLEGMEKDVANVIIEVSRKVIEKEISTKNEILFSLIKQAFDKCVEKQELVLKVSPKDYNFVTENKERILSMLEGVSDYSIKKDFALKPESCIVETPFGSVDSGIETKLKRIEEAFHKVVRKLNVQWDEEDYGENKL